MLVENQTTEFKREYTDNIKKTVIAFANTDGGNLHQSGYSPIGTMHAYYKDSGI